VGVCLCPEAFAQTALTWQQVKAKFEADNPNLRAGQLNIQESKAQEVTAYLRPNPNLTAGLDQLDPFTGSPYRPFAYTFPLVAFDYLHERQHKRELRLESAQKGTTIAESQQLDLERTLLFTLRSAFVQTLQAKALLESAKENLDYFEKELSINRARFKSGDIARVDLDRLVLQRAQYESDYQTAIVNARTAKITLLTLLNERTPVDQFDVTGPFDFSSDLKPLTDFEQAALDARPDLRAAVQAIEQAKTNHKLAIANGSADPTFGAWYTYNSSNNNPNATQTLGLSVEVPLRIFDKNQGEKQRTLIDIDRNQQLTDAARAQVFSDVDSAYEQVRSNIALLEPYKAQYRDQATRVRDTVTYSYQRGGASLMDFLNAQSDYRVVQLAYLQLVGSYLTAASQLDLAVGREVIP
jgi:cobalt-zinc-cadmium efflux system outer membrane protein